MNILLVDDEPGIREGLAVLLRRKGHEVRTAADCASARSALTESEYDVVVTDWRLPDGTAAAYLADCRAPALAVSGHPEEVSGAPAVRAVLQKPVTPSQLEEWLHKVVAPTPAAPTKPLPADVAAVVEAATELLGGDVKIYDDGTYVAVVGVGQDPQCPERLAKLGGDRRLLRVDGAWRAELRWFRDGRPDGAVPVVRAEYPWPRVRELAVDLDGADEDPAAFAEWLDEVAVRRSRGERVHLLNVPRALHFWAISHGRAHDMPMRGAIGPQLPADLADLWSEP
ncbi:MAG: hypothetical protein RL398_371 [Planctomycetota bacterium]